jgi:2Fe-2S ferredoxin
MPKVSFVPLGKSREIKAGATILAAANQCHVPIGQSCNGDGICGWCRVTVLEGLDRIGPPGPLEQRLSAEKRFAPQERAACLAKVRGDVVVTTTYWSNE